MTQCKEYGNVKVWEETFPDFVVPVPMAKKVKHSSCVPTIQKLLEERLKFELRSWILKAS